MAQARKRVFIIGFNLKFYNKKIINKFKLNYEKKIIKQALINLNLVKLNDVDKLLRTAEEKEKESNQIVEFTKEIKKN